MNVPAWPTVRLEEVASIERGMLQPEEIKPGTPYVGLEHVDSDGRIFDVEEVDQGELGSTKYAFNPSHVLYGKLRPYLKKTARPDFAGICSTEIVPLRPGPQLDRGFLYHYLRHPKTVELAVARCAGANLPRISPREILSFELPLPPLSEQRRLATLLDIAESIHGRRKRAVELAGKLLRSTFLQLFGDPVTNPKGWPMSTFGAQLKLLEYGPRFYNEKYASDGVRIVRITDLDQAGTLTFDSMPRLVVSEADRDKYALHSGDLIFARSGATVGKTALIESGDPEAIAGAYFIRMRFDERVSPRFAREVIANEHVQQMIIARSRQSAQQNFSGPGLRDLPLPVPPRDLQNRLDAISKQQRELVTDMRRAIADAERLFESLMYRSFRGELSPAGRDGMHESEA